MLTVATVGTAGRPPRQYSHPRGGVIDVTAPVASHMVQSFNLLGLDVKRYEPIEESPEE